MAQIKPHGQEPGDPLSASDPLSTRDAWADREPAPGEDRSWLPAQPLPVLMWRGSDRLQQLFNTALASYPLIAIDRPTALIDRWQVEPGWVLIDLATAGQQRGDSALDVLVLLGQVCPNRPLPAILLIAPGQERDALAAMKLGAADYLFTTDLTAEALEAKLCLPPGQTLPLPQVAQFSEPYRDLVEHSPDIVERFDCDLRHLYVSPVLAELTGVDTEVFWGKTCRELGMDETMVNAWEAAAATALATGENQAIEFSTPTQRGVRHFEMAIAPERDRTGAISSLLCVSRDITDRITAQQTHQQRLAAAKAAEQAATVAHDGLASVFDRINDGIIAFDGDARCVYLNRSAESILGRSLVDLKGQPIWTAFPEAVETPVYEAYNRAFDQQQPEFLAYYFPPLEGWFEVRLYPDRDGMTIYFTDISDRQAAIVSHQHSESLSRELSVLEHILDSVLAGYWEIDFTHDTTYLSPGFKQMFGYADHELPNHADTWQTLMLPEDLPRDLACMERHLQSQGVVPYYNEVRYRHKDGSLVWVICAGQVIDWDEVGQARRMVGCHVDITQLKQAEIQLQTHRAHLQEAQRIGNFGSWEMNLATQRLTWSDQVYAIFGYDPALGTPTLAMIQQQFDPEDLAEFQQVVTQAIEVGQTYDREFRIFRPDHTLVYIQAKGERLVDGAGRPTHLTGTVQDISDRKHDEAERQRTEAELQKLSLRLSLALQSARIGTWERHMTTDEIIWDQCLIDLYGFEPQGRSPGYADWLARVYAEDLPKVTAAEQALIDHDTHYDLEFRIWRSDGSLAWIRSSALVQRDSQGYPLSVIGVNYDITNQKRAETQLRDLTMRLELALESGGIGTWEIDLVSLDVTWDGRMYAMYGLTPSEAPLTFHDWRCCVSTEDIDHVDAVFAGVLAGSADSAVEFRILRRDGEQRWIRATALVQYDDGQPRCLIGTNVDITAAKQAETHLLRTTAQLTTSNRELEAFAYSVSHDLRAPLRAIDGFSRALVEDYGDHVGDEGRDYFDRIRHNVGRMGQLIDDLLRLSRVSRSAMSFAPVDLSALVQAQIADLRAAEPDRTVAVTVAPALTVSADPTLMQVAIANLVQNAWKFTSHHPTAHLEFGTTRQNSEIAYYLRDDGAGFDMAYADKLFGVFQRLHNTDEFPGTGIGLATVQRAIHRHGGSVWAEGAVEQGATVYFTLPQQSPLPEIAL